MNPDAMSKERARFRSDQSRLVKALDVGGMTDHCLRDTVDAKRSFGQAICQRIRAAIDQLGYAPQGLVAGPDYESAQFNLVTDPFSQSLDLVGHWYGTGKQRIGLIQFHGDGSFYAEYDVVQPHPLKPQFFVEAITAWGRQDNIKAEAKLLEIPGD